MYKFDKNMKDKLIGDKSITEIAESLNISREYLSAILNGRTAWTKSLAISKVYSLGWGSDFDTFFEKEN